MSEITPKRGWAHFACTDCGNVRMLPSGSKLFNADMPWCVHNGDYSWHGPSSPTNEYGWTPMVYATVQVAS